jgi:tRNA modification GTPase
VDTSSASSYLRKRDDTIAAPATPQGRGALSLIRVSGPLALGVVERLTGKSYRERTLTLVSIPGVGQAMVAVFVAPRSYTGQDMAEISLHGNPILVERLMRLLSSSGIRAAGPGEFTFRAYVSGKMDLARAEAVGELVRAVHPLQVDKALSGAAGAFSRKAARLKEMALNALSLTEAALEFPEEGLGVEDIDLKNPYDRLFQEARLLRDACARSEKFQAFHVVIAGPPNAGKSTLFNALLGYERTLVAPVPGTTRDVIHETLWLKDFPMERMAVEKTLEALAQAARIIYLVDGSLPASGQMSGLDKSLEIKCLFVANKMDLGLHPDWRKENVPTISAKTGAGVSELWRLLEEWVDVWGREGADVPFLITLRQEEALTACLESLDVAIQGLKVGRPLEMAAEDLADAVRSLQDLIGEVTPADVLDGVFSRFCVGK